MTTESNISKNVGSEKVLAERLNSYAASTGCIALLGASAATCQIIPGFV